MEEPVLVPRTPGNRALKENYDGRFEHLALADLGDRSSMLLFGKGRSSDMMGDVAKGIKSFKKGMAEEDDQPIQPLRPPRLQHPAADRTQPFGPHLQPMKDDRPQA